EPGAALPARGIGEPPRLVGAEALVRGGDLAGRQRDAGEHAAHLAGRASGTDERRGHLLASLAGLGDLREAQLVRRVGLEPAPGEVDPCLRVRVGPILADQAALDLEVDDRRSRLAALSLPERLEVEVAEDGPLE